VAKQNTQGDLRKVLEEEIQKVTTTHNINLDTAVVALWGRPGIFRPAYQEFIQDLYHNVFESFMHIVNSGGNTFFLQELFQTIPGRILVPLFSKEFFERISSAFNNAKIGIVFNSYNPIDGCEYVHLNESARMLLSAKSKRPEAFNKGRQNTYRDRTYYQEISEDAVRDGLWIYQYGFDQKSSAFLDGAYYRPVILSELVYAEEIYVIRPINYRWIGSLPKNYIGIEDLKTEVGFNGSYAGERHQVNLINKLLDSGALPRDRYHKITLHEIEIEVQRGYFDYIFEKLEVFDRAFEASMAALDAVQSPSPDT
jgi:hypothetical protein